MKQEASLAAISAGYDVFLLDLWGVVHDGTSLYPGVKSALQQLRAQQKTVIFLSNAPRRTHKVKAVLNDLGVDELLYAKLVASGEVGHQWLASGRAPYGKHYYFVGAAKDADVLEGLPFSRVDDIKQADFILNTGFGSEEQTADDFTALFHTAHGLSLPMLCLNPDLEVIKITGERFQCAGVLAQAYKQLGGAVKYFGKPYAEVYEFCLQGIEVDKSRILAVGDSLETDMPGGQAFGVDTMLITGGILKHLSYAEIMHECTHLGLRPTYIAPSLAG